MTAPQVDTNHQLVVRIVVCTIAALAVLLYGAAVLLSALSIPVPGELWLGAGNASGALAALLVNSKTNAVQQVGAALERVTGSARAAAARAGVPAAAVEAASDAVTELAVEAVEQAADQVAAGLPEADERDPQDVPAKPAARRRR